VTALLLAISGGSEYLVHEPQLTRKRLWLAARDEAGYATMKVIVVGLLAVVVVAIGAVPYMTVISKAIHTRHGCNVGSPCG
jgi:hypothetical protein